MAEVKADPVLNKEDDTLPYAYFHPEKDGKLTWICGEDQEGKITSVFCMELETHRDKKCEYLPDIEKARWVRQQLIDAGWQKLKPPEVTFTFPGEKESRTLNRKQKRYLQRKIRQMQQHNPFKDSGGDPSSQGDKGEDIQ